MEVDAQKNEAQETNMRGNEILSEPMNVTTDAAVNASLPGDAELMQFELSFKEVDKLLHNVKGDNPNTNECKYNCTRMVEILIEVKSILYLFFIIRV